MVTSYPPTVGGMLAGGRATRIGGGDKPLRLVGGRSILDRVVTVLRPQCEALCLNANGDPARFSEFAVPVIADSVADFPGPLAGVLALLDWAAASRLEMAWVLTVSGDCPFLPDDLVARLHAARVEQKAEMAIAGSASGTHPVIAVWPLALRDDLRHAISAETVRRVRDFIARYRVATATWPHEEIDPFFNVNTEADLAEAKRLADTSRR